jgi:hypothetical protein
VTRQGHGGRATHCAVDLHEVLREKVKGNGGAVVLNLAAKKLVDDSSRLTRNLADGLRTTDLFRFNAIDVVFVSQNFDTSQVMKL